MLIRIEDLDTLLTSVEFSMQRVRDAHGTPYQVRCETLARLDHAAEALRLARQALT